jgi:hypothetical protein
VVVVAGDCEIVAALPPVMNVPVGGVPMNHWTDNGPVPFALTLSWVAPPTVMLAGFALAVAVVGGVQAVTVTVTWLLRIGPVLQALLTCTRNVDVAVSAGVTMFGFVVVPPTGLPFWKS